MICINMTEWGILPMSGKPVHRGHWALIERAATENDKVVLFVSTSDRKRKGEITISGEDMNAIWTQHLVPALPSNVTVTFGGSPVRKVYEMLDKLSSRSDIDAVRVYGGAEDLTANFSDASLRKYAGKLMKAGVIELVPANERMFGISGTAMRELLSKGDMRRFMAELPPVPSKSKCAIWDLLRSRIDEACIREFVRTTLIR